MAPANSHFKTRPGCRQGLRRAGAAQVYILDQVRALEKEMVARIAAAGLPEIQPRILVSTPAAATKSLTPLVNFSVLL